VIVGVNVEEKPTGSLNFGASFSSDTGVGLSVGLKERNFLGRGQGLNFSFNTASADSSFAFKFTEPAFLGRDLKYTIDLNYITSNQSNSNFSTRIASLSTGLEFPISENGRLGVRYTAKADDVHNVEPGSSPILINEEALGQRLASSIGYTYSFDTRRTGLNPNAGFLVRFSQDFGGVGGDQDYVLSQATLGAETKVLNEEVTLRAALEGGALVMLNGDESRVTDRFFLTIRRMRGFEPNGVGPRDTTTGDALGGNYYVAARLEAQFPLGLPEEYGITGGVFLDGGSVWNLDNLYGTGVDDSLHWRSSVGVSIFWDTAIGPLRFNFSKVLVKQPYDLERNFDLTISTQF